MASGNDIKTNTATYNGFIKAATWGTVFCVIVAAFVVMLISS
jgi:hypothetical protein